MKTSSGHSSETNREKLVPFSLFTILLTTLGGSYHFGMMQDTLIFDGKIHGVNRSGRSVGRSVGQV